MKTAHLSEANSLKLGNHWRDLSVAQWAVQLSMQQDALEQRKAF